MNEGTRFEKGWMWVMLKIVQTVVIWGIVSIVDGNFVIKIMSMFVIVVGV
jgi:hypothetical protein